MKVLHHHPKSYVVPVVDTISKYVQTNMMKERKGPDLMPMPTIMIEGTKYLIHEMLKHKEGQIVAFGEQLSNVTTKEGGDLGKE
jgi:hypothetical protein